MGIRLLRQTNRSIPQQINITGKSEEGDGVKMFFIADIIHCFRFVNCNRTI